MKVAALDLGSNTFLLLVAEVEEGIVGKVYADELVVTRLGQGVHQSRLFHPDALKRAKSCLSSYRKIISDHKVDKIVAVATSAARDVTNSEELFKICEELSLPVQVVTGDLEAKLTFKGALGAEDDPDGCVVIDVGGGSTEVIGQTLEKISGCSIDVGSVRLTEMFVTQHPVARNEVEAMSKYVASQLERAQKKLPKGGRVLAVAGTPTTLTTVDLGIDYCVEKVHGHMLTLQNIFDWRDQLAAMPLETRKTVVGMDPQRADVIVAGATILGETLKFLEMSELKVSVRGVRYGIASLWEDLSASL